MLSSAPTPQVIDLGRLPYADAYALQVAHNEEVLAARASGSPDPGRILLVEHDPPVITISRRPGAAAHLIASPDTLGRAGVTIAQTDRGGDITYHGPGQLVVYPILDLNLYRLRLHDYMRLLEAAVIDTLADFDIRAQRDVCATGVWVPECRHQGIEATRHPDRPSDADGSSLSMPQCLNPSMPSSKICAMGVRIRRWVSLHGLALNVTTNLDHFDLIVPCGLAGRTVTSMLQILGARCPSMPAVKHALVESLRRHLTGAHSSTKTTPPALEPAVHEDQF